MVWSWLHMRWSYISQIKFKEHLWANWCLSQAWNLSCHSFGQKKLFWTFTRWRCHGSSAKSKNRLTSAWDLVAGFFLILSFYFLVFLWPQACVQQHWLLNYRYSDRGLLDSIVFFGCLPLRIFKTCDLAQNICRCDWRIKCARSASMEGPSWGQDLFRFVYVIALRELHSYTL